MFVVEVIAESMALVLGAVLVAGVFCALAANFADRWPRRGRAAYPLLVLVSLLCLSGLVESPLVRLGALCSLFGAAFLWASDQGRADELQGPISQGSE